MRYANKIVFSANEASSVPHVGIMNTLVAICLELHRAFEYSMQ